MAKVKATSPWDSMYIETKAPELVAVDKKHRISLKDRVKIVDSLFELKDFFWWFFWIAWWWRISYISILEQKNNLPTYFLLCLILISLIAVIFLIISLSMKHSKRKFNKTILYDMNRIDWTEK